MSHMYDDLGFHYWLEGISIIYNFMEVNSVLKSSGPVQPDEA